MNSVNQFYTDYPADQIGYSAGYINHEEPPSQNRDSRASYFYTDD